MKRVLTLALALVVTAPSLAMAEVPRLAEEVPEAALADVRVEGNRRVGTDAILRRMKTRKGEPLDRDDIVHDIGKLWELGFFEDVEVALLDGTEAGADGPVVVFRVVEKPAIREIRYEGLDEISKEDAEDLVHVRAHAILDLDEVESSAHAIEKKYREKGFYLAEVTPKIIPVPDEAAVDVVFDVNERAKVEVKKIRFIGNRQVPDRDIKGFMETREGSLLSFFSGGGTYNEEAFERDQLRISAVYYDRGFINVQVGKPQVSLTPDKKYIYITIPVEEGDPYTVGEVKISGETLGQDAEAMKNPKMTPGALFVRSQLGEDLFSVQDFYRDQGYAFVNVTPLTNIDTEKKTIDLNLEVRLGNKIRIERIEIHGNTRTRDKVIRRELRIAEGELYNGSHIKRSKQRVNALGYFETVDLATRPGEREDTVVLEFNVKERPTGTFQVGAGLSTGEGPLITAQIAHDNLFGRGQSVSFSWQYSRLRNIFQLQFMEPYFLDLPVTFGFGAYNTRSDFFDFIRTATGGNLTWGYQFTDPLRVFATYTLEKVNESALASTSGALPDNFFNNGWTSSVKLSTAWDSRDNRLFPTSGWYNTASFEIADRALLSQNEFTRWSLVGRYYHPLPFGIVGRVKAEYGQIAGRRFPRSERYFLGGVFSLRGYLLRSITPQEYYPSRGDPMAATSPVSIGGNRQALLNIELEFPIFTAVGIRGVLFYDAGNTWSENQKLFEDHVDLVDLPLGLFQSVGFGFRWFSPMGPLRFEWGIPLTRRPQDRAIRFEFMIGNFF